MAVASKAGAAVSRIQASTARMVLKARNNIARSNKANANVRNRNVSASKLARKAIANPAKTSGVRRTSKLGHESPGANVRAFLR